MDNIDQEKIINDLREKKVAVLGLGVTSTYLIKFLSQQGIKLTVCDMKDPSELEQTCSKFADFDISYRLGKGYMDDLADFEIVFLSPGINPMQPKIIEAKNKGVIFSSEIELLFQLSKAPIVGITGSSGKTTTTTLTGLILSEAYEKKGFRAYVGGNIGTPLIDKVLEFTKDDIVLLELSSFQLKFLRESAHIGAVLNITPNHLDVHPDMDDYISAKKNLIKYQKQDDIAILNLESELTAALIDETAGRKLFFSLKKRVENGAFLAGTKIVFASEGTEQFICDISEIKIPGMHNVENILATVAITMALDIPLEIIREHIKSFTGVSHRLEKVRIVDGVTFINDSISTTPSRAIAGLKAINFPIIQIAGGYDKKLPFDEMADVAVERVKGFILIGNTASKIESALKQAASKKGINSLAIFKATTLEEAIKLARDIATEGDVVLLSPACASYDMFKNYEERGNLFKEIVKSL